VISLSSVEAPIGSTETETWDLPALGAEGRVALADFAGKPTVAAFFASWCTVCRRELPGFGDLSHQLGGQVNFVGINTMNNGGGLGFAADMNIGDWPLARDIGMQDGRQLASNFGAVGSPTTVIYDASGKVVDVTLGGMTAETLRQKLQTLFGINA
jgi:thiol-disulfide isomerase/thioredoxin